jgi:peptide/nickel transport system permease protein
LNTGSLKYYIIRRLIYAVLIAFGVVTITFILLRLGPSSPADKYLANMASRAQNPAAVTAAIEARYGLDKPLYVQYFDYLTNLIHGDWGWSFSTSMPVLSLIAQHWIYSFQLVLLATLLSAGLGIVAGVYTAVKGHSAIDYVTSFLTLVAISIPNFWLGIMLILVFAVRLGWFKTYYDTGLPLLSFANLKSLVLPVLTLATGAMAGYTRYARTATLDNLHRDYVRTARAKGLPEWIVIGKHVFRNALLPIVTVIMFDLAGVAFGGAYLTEIIFGIPGLGRVSFNAVFNNDYPVVITITLIGAIVVLLTNLATDIVYTWLDPRVRYDTGEGFDLMRDLALIVSLLILAMVTIIDLRALSGLLRMLAYPGLVLILILVLYLLRQIYNSRRLAHYYWDRIRRHRQAVGGLVFIGLLMLLAVFGPFFTPDPAAVNFAEQSIPPCGFTRSQAVYDITTDKFTVKEITGSWQHPLGTDDKGRDMLAMLISGTRVSLAVGLLSTLIAIFIGTVMGVVSGYLGGWPDNILMRFTDIMMTFPFFLLLVFIVFLYGPSLTFIIMAAGRVRRA